MTPFLSSHSPERAGQHHCSMGMVTSQGRASAACGFSKQGEARCVLPKNTGHSLLRQGTPGFPLALNFSSTEVRHLKLFQEFGDWSSPLILPGNSSLFLHLYHLGLLRKDGSQLASQCPAGADQRGQSRTTTPWSVLKRVVLSLSHSGWGMS